MKTKLFYFHSFWHYILTLHLDLTFLLGLYFDRLGQKALYILMKFTPI